MGCCRNGSSRSSAADSADAPGEARRPLARRLSPQPLWRGRTNTPRSGRRMRTSPISRSRVCAAAALLLARRGHAASSSRAWTASCGTAYVRAGRRRWARASSRRPAPCRHGAVRSERRRRTRWWSAAGLRGWRRAPASGPGPDTAHRSSHLPLATASSDRSASATHGPTVTPLARPVVIASSNRSSALSGVGGHQVRHPQVQGRRGLPETPDAHGRGG